MGSAATLSRLYKNMQFAFRLATLIRTIAIGRAVPCTFVIDGFDECSTNSKNSQLHSADGRSEFLEILIKNTADTRARVLILSRDNEDIRAQLGMLTKDTTPMLLEYGISADDTRSDIDHCSSHMVNTRLPNKSTQLKVYLASEAARKSDGMFLWLQYLSHELDPGENAKRLHNIVSEMPAEINEMYERDLEKVQSLKPARKVRAIAVLRWITFALRPLTVRELAEAIAATIDESAETYPHDDMPDSWDSGYVDEQYVNSHIRRSCGSLVELRGHAKNKPLALHTVHFTHFSVKEYLLNSDVFNNGQTRLERICFPDGGKEHDTLARLCLQYLCYDVFGEKPNFRDGRKIQVYPFLAYAAKYWYMHALRDQRMSEDILPWTEKLFNPSTSNWILWSSVFEGDLQLNDEPSYARSLSREDFPMTSTDEAEDIGDVDNRPGLIYYAALFGLTNVVKALQSQGFDCSARGGMYGFPLQAAIHNAHQETVEYLVQQGIDLNQRGGFYNLAICAAAAKGLDRISDILIKAGADVTSENPNGRNCLHFACMRGARATVKILLEAGADPLKKSRHGTTIHAVDRSGFTPLDFAIGGGRANLENVKYLVENGALATQGRGHKATETSTNPALEGHWKGTYTYDHWRNGPVGATQLMIRFAPASLSSSYPFWECRECDEAGMFDVVGHLFADNTIRFAKLYGSHGWLYLGIFDADAMIIWGTWGGSMTGREGSFELKKV